ncbi:MAG: circadian clock protein KaiC [Vicinamibacterales bacterium]
MAIAKLTTGIPGFDILTHGGIPEGRSTLVVGRSGTGKTVLALQLAAHLAQLGVPTMMLGVEETTEDLLATGESLGLDLGALMDSRTLHMIDLSRPADGPTVVSGEYDIFGLVHRLEAAVRDHQVRVVILDSATALFSPLPPREQLRNHFFQLVSTLRRLDVTGVILAEAPQDYGPLTTLGVEDYVCDLVVILRNTIDGDRRRRSIEVNKYRRSGHFKGEYPCTITTHGVVIFPQNPRERADVASIERFSSGVAGLDEMTHGGWLRNSLIIVRGPTGSGKTMLAGLYARAGAIRGERVVYYGFEEPRPVLVRNFEAIGMPMVPLIDSGNLRIMCRYPESTSLEDLLVSLRSGLEEFGPSLVVMDSISSIEHASSEKGFRQFVIGMASLLREHGRSALMTQTVTAGESASHTAPYLSTVADSILAMDYETKSYNLNRSMRVIKMRGSDHATHPYILRIGSGGLHVERMPPPAA